MEVYEKYFRFLKGMQNKNNNLLITPRKKV